MRKLTIALASLALASADRHQGTESLCVGPTMHSITYDMNGDTLETASDILISVHPVDGKDGMCSPSAHGDKAICVGANVDETCRVAEKDLPLNTAIDCSNCFAGGTTNFHYELNVSGFELQGVEVGLMQSHVRGAVEVHAHPSGSAEPAKGHVEITNDRFTPIKFMVGGVVPVYILFGMPTLIAYTVDVAGSADVTAGIDLDVDLGDNSIRWTKASGFQVFNSTPKVTPTPVLAVSAKAEGNLTLALVSSFRIQVDNVMWYHLDTVPSTLTKLAADTQSEQVCLDANGEFRVTHEADVDFTLFGKDHEIYHFGPKELFDRQKDGIVHACKEIPISSMVV